MLTMHTTQVNILLFHQNQLPAIQFLSFMGAVLRFREVFKHTQRALAVIVIDSFENL